MADIKRRMCGGDLAPIEGSTDAECNGKLNGPSAAIPGASGTKEENIRRLIARSAAAQKRIAAGDGFTVGLRSDGPAVAVGYNNYGQCEVDGWRGVAAISAGGYHTVGLKSDGTVVATSILEYNFTKDQDPSNVTGWTDIVAISAGCDHTVGLRSDGTVVATGNNDEGECNVSDWKLFNSIDTLEQEIEEGHRAAERRKRQRRIEDLNREAALRKEELSNLSGPSADKRRRKIEEWLSEIERELSQLI